MTFIILKIWPDIDTSAIVYYLSYECFNKKHMCILCLPTYGKHENGVFAYGLGKEYIITIGNFTKHYKNEDDGHFFLISFLFPK